MFFVLFCVFCGESMFLAIFNNYIFDLKKIKLKSISWYIYMNNNAAKSLKEYHSS